MVINNYIALAPQNSFGFRFSGRTTGHEYTKDAAFERFQKQTGIHLECTSVDAAFYRHEWQGVSPAVEVGYCDFRCTEYYHTKPLKTAQQDLFA